MADNADQDPKPTDDARRRTRRGSEAPRNSESERAQPSVAGPPTSADSDDLSTTARSPRQSTAEPPELEDIDIGALAELVDPQLVMGEILIRYERNMRDHIENALYDEYGEDWLERGVISQAKRGSANRMRKDLAKGYPGKAVFGTGDFPWIIKNNEMALPLRGHRTRAEQLCAKIYDVRNHFVGHDKWNRTPSREDTEGLAEACASMWALCRREAQIEEIRRLLAGYERAQSVDLWSMSALAPGPTNDDIDAPGQLGPEAQSQAESAEREGDPATVPGGSETDPKRRQQGPDERTRLEAAAATEQLGHEQRAPADAGEARRIASSTRGGSSDGGGGPGAATLAGAGDEDRSPLVSEGGGWQRRRVRRWLRQHLLLLAAFAAPAIAAIIVFVALDQAGVFPPADQPPPPPIVDPLPPPPGQEEQEQPATMQKEQEQEGTTTQEQQEQQEQQDPKPVPDDPPLPNVLTSLSVGVDHSCGLTANGAAACWGSDKFGQTRVPSGTFTAISSGGAHTCGLRENGTASCWGWSGYGQTSAPEDRFSSISAGLRHNCGITVDNTIRCWGYNEYGQSADQLTSEFTAVSAGYHHNCAIKTNGDVVCWGFRDNGQTAAPSGPFTAVSAGSTHTCGLRPSGSVECWGEDKAGGTQAPPTDRFVAVSAGQFHSCGILESGAVRCWGDDEHGRATPPEGNFVSIDAGPRHTCGTRDDGSVICWGDDSLGQRDVAAAVIGDYDSAVVEVEVREPPPPPGPPVIDDISCTPASPMVGEKVDCSAELGGGGEPDSWFWSLNGNLTSQSWSRDDSPYGDRPTYTTKFDLSGSYELTLTVEKGADCVSASHNIVVRAQQDNDEMDPPGSDDMMGSRGFDCDGMAQKGSGGGSSEDDMMD